MRRALWIASATLLPAVLTAQEGGAKYEELVKMFSVESAQYRKADAAVENLLPDVIPMHAVFSREAKERAGTDAMLPFLGWLLQNAPRNKEACEAAVAGVDELAVKQAKLLLDAEDAQANIARLYQASRKAVRHLKYNKVSDQLFAQTLLDAKAVALATEDAKIRDACKRSIFKLERLQVGMVAPNIIAKDLDGVEFKLSDYRGKVVVIDFWGDW